MRHSPIAQFLTYTPLFHFESDLIHERLTRNMDAKIHSIRTRESERENLWAPVFGVPPLKIHPPSLINLMDGVSIMKDATGHGKRGDAHTQKQGVMMIKKPFEAMSHPGSGMRIKNEWWQWQRWERGRGRKRSLSLFAQGMCVCHVTIMKHSSKAEKDACPRIVGAIFNLESCKRVLLLLYCFVWWSERWAALWPYGLQRWRGMITASGVKQCWDYSLGCSWNKKKSQLRCERERLTIELWLMMKGKMRDWIWNEPPKWWVGGCVGFLGLRVLKGALLSSHHSPLSLCMW